MFRCLSLVIKLEELVNLTSLRTLNFVWVLELVNISVRILELDFLENIEIVWVSMHDKTTVLLCPNWISSGV